MPATTKTAKTRKEPADRTGAVACSHDATRHFVAAMVQTAGIHLETGSVEDAERCLRMGLQRRPEDTQCLAYLAVCAAMRNRNIAAADKLARKVVAENPTDATAHYALGRVQLAAGNRRNAFATFARARRLAVADRRMQIALDRIEPRRTPVLPFLSRNSLPNIVFGMLRAWMYRLMGR